MAQTVRSLPAIQETWVQSQDWEHLLEEGMATHSSILAWRIPWTEESRGYSPRGRKESDTTEWLTPTHGAETEADGTQQIFFFLLCCKPSLLFVPEASPAFLSLQAMVVDV